jgi:hypothetical protein
VDAASLNESQTRRFAPSPKQAHFAKQNRIGAQFRELVRHAREMHDLRRSCFRQSTWSGLSVTAENAIEHVEELAPMPDETMQ